MGNDLPISLLREGFGVLASVGAPFLIALMVVGLIVGVVQAATQINDSALSFLPKLLTGIAISWMFGSWAVERLAQYLIVAFNRMSQHI
jgi:flagellar biosynthetic protein FliQ